jgi:amidophosphoribosyltransferase
MCGVFGIHGHDEAANLAYLGLHALQHRGQESAGIVAGDKALRRHVGMGLVTDVFDEKSLVRLPGRAAIGHTRYSTAGSSEVRNAQPFLFDYSGGSVAIAHDGNLVNAEELRTRLEASGSIFQTTSDTECIVHLMAKVPEFDPVARLIAALRQVTGAYSLVLLADNKLIGVRDPHGFRPLVIGRFKDSFVLSSETSSIDQIEAEYIRDVEPGELVVIDERGLTSHRVQPEPVDSRFCVFDTSTSPAPDSLMSSKSVPGPRAHGHPAAIEQPAGPTWSCRCPTRGSAPPSATRARAASRSRWASSARTTWGARSSSPRTRSATGVRLKLAGALGGDGKRVVVVDDSLVAAPPRARS